MEIRTIYDIDHKIGDIYGPLSPRYYVDTSKHIKPVAVKYKHKETIFEELQKKAKLIPGPGKYIINP